MIPLKKIVVDFGSTNSDAQVSSSDTGWVDNELALISEVMHYANVPYEQTRTAFRIEDPKTFNVDWQITKSAKDPKWVTGDHLVCKHEDSSGAPK